MIHCLHDLDDLEQPTRCEMRVRFDYLHTHYELVEIVSFRAPQRVSLKERNDRRKKIAPLAYNELIQMLFVVVVSAIAV